MSGLVNIHVLAAGLWLGCVLVEVFFERALAGRDEHRLLLGRLHRNVDLFIELPALLAVLASGALLIGAAAPGAALYLMIGLGVIAVAANIYCLLLVLRRRRLALAGDWSGFERADHLQHKVGAVVLVAVVAAMAAGLLKAF
jgi:hypothetical protein